MVEKKSNNYGIVAAVILFVALIIGNYFQYQLSPLAPRLMETMGLTPGQFSSAFSAPMIPSIFLGIVAGVLADKFGVKNVAAVGLAVTAIGLCVRPFTYDYLTLFVSMILGGVGVSFLNANMSKIVGGWFPPEKVGPIVGLTMVGSTIGMTLGSATTALLPSVKVAFWISGIGSVVVLIIWVLFMKDGTLNQEAAVPQESVMDSVRVVLKSKNIWLVGFCLMCIMGCNVALASFLPTALQSRGISESTAGVLSSVITIGSLIGTFIGPTIVAKAGRMKPLLMVLGVMTAVGAAFGWSLPIPGAIALLALAGFGMGTLIPVFMSFPVMLPEIGPVYAGSAGGVITTLELLGAVVLPTYVITPVAASNFLLYFMITGALMLVMAAIVILLPELNKK